MAGSKSRQKPLCYRDNAQPAAQGTVRYTTDEDEKRFKSGKLKKKKEH